MIATRALPGKETLNGALLREGSQVQQLPLAGPKTYKAEYIELAGRACHRGEEETSCRWIGRGSGILGSKR